MGYIVIFPIKRERSSRSVFQEVSREPDISSWTYSPGHFSLEVFPPIKPEGRCFTRSVRWHNNVEDVSCIKQEPVPLES